MVRGIEGLGSLNSVQLSSSSSSNATPSSYPPSLSTIKDTPPAMIPPLKMTDIKPILEKPNIYAAIAAEDTHAEEYWTRKRMKKGSRKETQKIKKTHPLSSLLGWWSSDNNNQEESDKK